MSKASDRQDPSQVLEHLSRTLSFARALETFPGLTPTALRELLLRAAHALALPRDAAAALGQARLSAEQTNESAARQPEEADPSLEQTSETPEEQGSSADATVSTILVDLFFDGASKGNPGPASVGYVIFDPEGVELVAKGEFIGRATNNSAEYQGLLRALATARRYGFQRLNIHSDSQLLVRQIKGKYRVKSPSLKKLYKQAMEQMEEFEEIHLLHVPRSLNARADELANLALGPILKKDSSRRRSARGGTTQGELPL